MWNAGTGAVACSALAMLDLPALVVPCKTIAVGTIAPNIEPAPIIREQITVALGTAMDYRTLCEELPAGVEPAYDGMVLEV